MLPRLPAGLRASHGGDLKLRGTNGKFLLNKCFEGRAPRETIERKKAGFPIPYESWFRDELRPFLRELLLGDQARERGCFRPGATESLLDRDAAGSGHAKELFATGKRTPSASIRLAAALRPEFHS